MKTILVALGLLALFSCAAVQGNPAVTGAQTGFDLLAARSPQEAAKASMYMAEQVEKIETAGRAVKAAAMCGEFCATSESKAAHEREAYRALGLAPMDGYCRASCGLKETRAN